MLFFYENSILREMIVGSYVALTIGKEGVVVIETGVFVLSHELLQCLLFEAVVLIEGTLDDVRGEMLLLHIAITKGIIGYSLDIHRDCASLDHF